MSDSEYVCAICGRTLEKGRPDVEAEAEYQEHFPAEVAAGEDRGIVCDDCWKWVYDPTTHRERVENFGRMPPWAVQTLDEMRAKLGGAAP